MVVLVLFIVSVSYVCLLVYCLFGCICLIVVCLLRCLSGDFARMRVACVDCCDCLRWLQVVVLAVYYAVWCLWLCSGAFGWVLMLGFWFCAGSGGFCGFCGVVLVFKYGGWWWVYVRCL